MRSRSSTTFAVAQWMALALAALASSAGAELGPDWSRRVPLGTGLAVGTVGFAVDPAGNSYVTGTSGSSGNADIIIASFAPDGTLRWSRVFDGAAGGHDQARALALGADGNLYVAGNTAGPGSYANVLLLEYDPASGTLLDAVQVAAEPSRSEHGASVAADAQGNVYIGGGTTGDGSDALILGLDPAGEVRWRATWDGAAWGPYSQDHAQEVLLDPGGSLLVMIHGVAASNHPDYVVVKYGGADGEVIWQAAWGVSGGDFPRDLEIDAVGDVYVTGIGIDLIDKYSTIKLDGDDGELRWQRYDAIANDHSASALALDGEGGIYVTGAADPEGDQSNFNDDFFTVKRHAETGELLWTHRYGASCVGCYDVPSDVVVGSGGRLFVAGSTSSPPYSLDALLLVLDSATGLEIDRGVVSAGGSEGVGTGILALDEAGNLYDGGRASNFDTGQVEMTVTRWGTADDLIFEDHFEQVPTAWTVTAP